MCPKVAAVQSGKLFRGWGGVPVFVMDFGKRRERLIAWRNTKIQKLCEIMRGH